MRIELNHIHSFVIKEFSLELKKSSAKGWIMSSKSCPFCGKADNHFGIRLNQPKGTYKRSNFISFHCVKCEERGGEYKLLREIGKLEILEGRRVNLKKPLQKKVVKATEEFSKLDLISPNFDPPIGFRRIQKSDYLDSRGFEPWQYDYYSVGITVLEPKMKDYVIFLIKEDGEIKGSVARTTRSKEWIQDYDEKVKKFNDNRLEGEKKKNKWLRWRNDEAEFNKLLMGLDEITDEVVFVILVEGVMDKANVDKLLRLNKVKKVKCLCTFGKKISDEQIAKLRQRGKNIETILLIYDPDALEDSKGEGWRLQQHYKNVLIGYTRENDPGDMDLLELNYIIDSAEPPLRFKMNKVQKRQLK